MSDLTPATLSFIDGGREYSVEFPSVEAAWAWWGASDSFDATVAEKITLEDACSMLKKKHP